MLVQSVSSRFHYMINYYYCCKMSLRNVVQHDWTTACQTVLMQTQKWQNSAVSDLWMHICCSWTFLPTSVSSFFFFFFKKLLPLCCRTCHPGEEMQLSGWFIQKCLKTECGIEGRKAMSITENSRRLKLRRYLIKPWEEKQDSWTGERPAKKNANLNRSL